MSPCSRRWESWTIVSAGPRDNVPWDTSQCVELCLESQWDFLSICSPPLFICHTSSISLSIYSVLHPVFLAFSVQSSFYWTIFCVKKKMFNTFPKLPHSQCVKSFLQKLRFSHVMPAWCRFSFRVYRPFCSIRPASQVPTPLGSSSVWFK